MYLANNGVDPVIALVRETAIRPDFIRAADSLKKKEELIIDRTLQVSRIPAPTFFEKKRALHVEGMLRSAGLPEVSRDQEGNVIVRLRGRDDRPGVMVAAHLDSAVTPEPGGEDGSGIRLDRVGGKLIGPGVGDNALAVATTAMLAEIMLQSGLQLKNNLYFVFTTGEEGLGNLSGMKSVFERLKQKVSCVVAVEGHFLGKVVTRGVGSSRLRISVAGPGGHSWQDAGAPSAVHGLVSVAGRILQAWDKEKGNVPLTTLNIGKISGGTAVNAIAASACMEIDLRSESMENLARISSIVETTLLNALPDSSVGLEVYSEVMGVRPAGSLPENHFMAGICSEALRIIGVEPVFSAASTDANVPLAGGVPAVTLGISRGGGMHTRREWIDIRHVCTGAKALLLSIIALDRHLFRAKKEVDTCCNFKQE